MIDTHSHIYDEVYNDDLTEVVARAKENGVEKVILPGIDSKCHQKLLDTSRALSSFAYPCIGLHPTSVDNDCYSELQFVTDNFNKDKFYAIGEIGIDKYWSTDFLEQQIEVFESQLILAYENDLPVIIHNREALEEIISSIKRVNKPIRGVFHAFSGSYETYERLSSLGDFYVGIGGVVTFKNAHVAKSVSYIPLDRILLETDAPWLTPTPHRGERNESSYIKYVAQKIAEIKSIPFETVDNTTTTNAKRLFNI